MAESRAPIPLADTSKLSREEWLALRRRGIGGSDIAAIAGLNPYKSPTRVFLEKTGQVEESEDEPSEAAKWGKLLEDDIAHEFGERTGLKVARVNQMLQSSNPETPFMIGNIDRRIYDPRRPKGDRYGVLECKCTGEWALPMIEAGETPPRYLLQNLHYQYVTGWRWGWLAILVGGNRLFTVYVERDEDMIKNMLTIARHFWGLVEAGTPPLVDGSESTSEALNLVYPVSKATEIALPEEEAGPLLKEFAIAREQVAQWQNRAEQAANALKMLMKDAEAARCGDTRLLWKAPLELDEEKLKQTYPGLYKKFLTGFNVTEFKKQYPHVYREFARLGQTRVFRVLPAHAEGRTQAT